jgi:hypothetical protein
VSERVQLSVGSWDEFCTGGCDKRRWAGEAEESSLLEAVTRKLLLKRQQAIKRLSVCYGGL